MSAALRPRDIVTLALLSGILAGLLESLSHFLRSWGLAGMLPLGWYTLWMPAVANGAFFLLLGLLLAAVARAAPRLLTPDRLVGLLVFLAAMAALRVLDSSLSILTVDLIALGIGVRAGSWAGKRTEGIRRRALPAAATLVALTAALAAGVEGSERLTERRVAARRPAARVGAPNVLLLVLDTVRRLNLSVFGYERRTTPALEALAARGVRFENALSTAPWTLPSHAGMLTGRWAHELSADWATPLDDAYPTLAEALTSQGYRTAGFVANVSYAGRSVGIGRGFGHFEDVPVSLPQIARSAAYTSWLTSRPAIKRRLPSFYKSYQRKSAAEVNAALVRWLDREPGRPFFAFLNYFDAHDPYRPAAPFDTAFGSPAYPPTPPSRHGGTFPDDRPRSPRPYDQAIASIDAEIGRLLRELERRGQLEHTLVIVTSDHGEEFGEHGMYGHGHTLNLQALNVGAVMALPERIPAGVRVTQRVSLRDLPATVLDLTGTGSSGTFPGASLARFWLVSGTVAETLFAESRLARNRPEWDPTSMGDLQSLIASDLQFIRHPDSTSQLYDIATDSLETRNLATDSAFAGTAGQFGQALDRVMGAPNRRRP
jgi:arylsulfatase A-like enzyme